LEEISKGIQMEVAIDNRFEQKTVRGVLLMGIADLSAKSDFLILFNGDCPSCYCKGENIPIIQEAQCIFIVTKTR